MKITKVVKTIIVGLFIIGFLSLSGLAAVILSPQILFSHSLEHGLYTVYANQPIDPSIIPIIDRAETLIHQSELYDSTYQFEIFLSHQTTYNRIDNLFFDPHAAARPTDNNIIVKVPLDITKGEAYTSHSTIELGYLLAHEMIHCLQENRYGKWTFNPFFPPPIWKLEGYPEYIARQPMLNTSNYRLVNEIDTFHTRFNESKDGFILVADQHYMPFMYYKSRLLTEYLMDIQHYSYDDILQTPLTEQEVYDAMLKWAREEK